MALYHDILTHIFDLLHNDKSTLSHCTRACRLWLSPSRSHLFSVVRVYGYDPDYDACDVESFSNFLDRAPPTIRYYIKRLEISAYKSPTIHCYPSIALAAVLENFDGSTLPPLLFSVCCDAISKLPRISELRLYELEVAVDTAIGLFPSVLALEISFVSLCDGSSSLTNWSTSRLTLSVLWTESTYWYIIRPFQNLRRLKMAGCDRGGLKAAPTLLPKLPLRHLCSHASDARLLQQFLEAKCLESITSLDVECGGYDTTPLRIMSSSGMAGS